MFFFRLYSRFLRSKPLVLPSFGSMKSSIAVESPMFSLLKSQECFDRPRRASCDFYIMRTWSIWLQINPPIAISMLKTWANSLRVVCEHEVIKESTQSTNESANETVRHSSFIHHSFHESGKMVSIGRKTEWASRHRTPFTRSNSLRQ